MLEKQGLLLRDDQTPPLDVESVDEHEHLLVASVHYRIATGPQHPAYPRFSSSARARFSMVVLPLPA